MADVLKMALEHSDRKPAKRLQVDFWLRTQGGPDAACEVRRILSDIEKLPDYSYIPRSRGLRTSSSGSMQEALNRVTKDDGLRVLLIYRAVLVAALYTTTLDTSCVEGTDLGKRVVRIL